MANAITTVRDWFKELAEWVQENLGDPYIVEALRDDLGLAPGESVPEAQRGQIKQFADGLDPDKEGFNETVADLKDLVDALVQMGEQLTEDPNSISGWDVAYLLGKLLAAEMIRTREPVVYAIGKTSLFIADDPEALTEFDPAVLVRQARGEASAPGSGEKLAERVSALASVVAVALERVLDKFAGPELLDAYYGWDPAPDSATPNADLVSSRATTLVVSLPKVADTTPKLALTVLGVPAEHGGPGLFLAFGGGGAFERKIEQTTLKIEAGAGSALDMFIGWDESPHGFEVGSGAAGFGRFSLKREGAAGAPAIRIGDADKTRLDIGQIGLGIDILADRAAFRVSLEKTELVIRPGEGDGFLSAMASGEIKLGFDFGLTADTRGGIRIDGGTRGRATIPVEKSLGGVLDIHTVELALAPGGAGYDLALEMATAFGLNLGPFRASVDRIGFQLQLAFRQGNLGFMEAALGFKAPNGLGLVLDAGLVKGGGYLFFDFERGEYAGALELRFATWGIKAIGILTTKLPDGSSGWALLLLVYAELPRFHIAFGIFFDSIGGLIGLHHGADVPALQTQLPQGVFDDILFPQNPVADAPRIINRLRVIFIIRRNAFLIGPMFRLSWGTPRLGEIKLGLVLAMDNALGGDGPVSLSKILLLGQVRIGMPETTRGDVVRIIVDFLGYLDFDAKRFGFFARLRDSRLAQVLELTGSLLLLIDYGEQPSFVVAVGGFHPRFKDLPPGLPAGLDRIGMKLKIASIVEISLQCYFAVTSATIQFGAELRVKVDLEVVSIEGYIGFDALIHYRPRFRFEVDFRAGMAIKVMGETLVGVSVEGTLAGPGRWRISGKAHFKILFFEFSPSFDEQWGEEPALPAEATSVSALLAAELSRADNWSTELPFGAETLATIAVTPGETKVLAHPSSQLRVSQKVAPLGLSLEKFGETAITGANRFDLEDVRIGGIPAASRQATREHLARGQYLNLSEEQKLSSPSFETFDVGVAVGLNDYALPADAVTAGNLDYETKYLVPGEEEGQLFRFELLISALSMDLFRAGAAAGAAAQSGLRARDRLRPAGNRKLSVSEPAVAAVDGRNFSTVADLDADTAHNWTLAAQALAAQGVERATLVEAYELEDQ